MFVSWLISHLHNTFQFFFKVLSDCNHPIYNLLPEIKDTNYNLRRETVVKSLVRTTPFMNVFSNRLIFRY